MEIAKKKKKKKKIKKNKKIDNEVLERGENRAEKTA